MGIRVDPPRPGRTAFPKTEGRAGAGKTTRPSFGHSVKDFFERVATRRSGGGTIRGSISDTNGTLGGGRDLIRKAGELIRRVLDRFLPHESKGAGVSGSVDREHVGTRGGGDDVMVNNGSSNKS